MHKLKSFPWEIGNTGPNAHAEFYIRSTPNGIFHILVKGSDQWAEKWKEQKFHHICLWESQSDSCSHIYECFGSCGSCMEGRVSPWSGCRSQPDASFGTPNRIWCRILLFSWVMLLGTLLLVCLETPSRPWQQGRKIQRYRCCKAEIKFHLET